MSLIRQGILESMSDLKASENDGISAKFLFPEKFIGFQGHFENNPVLPGVCKIQAIVAMYSKFQKKDFRLKVVNQAKFFLTVTCNQEITIECHSKLTSEGWLSVKALVKRQEEKISMLQIIIQPQA